ncbi:MAG: V-type ATP synthase subunit F [Flavonifractor plautii]
MSNYKIAVLGDKDSVLGFKALGWMCSPASAEEAKRTLHALAKENYAVVYLTEGYAAHMEAELERYKDALTPAIILIPGKDGSLGIGEWPTSSGRGACRGRGYFVAPYAHNALGAL